mmetsp:Transcript_34940/g.33980  ORF Transcript_34940/g.33980 Transcript_34940/m.33980 type:complete len:89 (+) Transcript_34940:265-531(+)
MKEENINNEEQKVEDEEMEDIFIPQAEYTAVCNVDFAPLICNDFVTEFLDKEHGACALERSEAVELTRNFCHWISHKGLTCVIIGINQ